MYAIIATGGKQYKVSEGDIITIEKLGVDAGEKVTFDQVLAVSGDDIIHTARRNLQEKCRASLLLFNGKRVYQWF